MIKRIADFARQSAINVTNVDTLHQSVNPRILPEEQPPRSHCLHLEPHVRTQRMNIHPVELITSVWIVILNQRGNKKESLSHCPCIQ